MNKVLNKFSAVTIAVATVAGLLATSLTWAHGGSRFHHRARIGVYIGGPAVWSPFWHQPYWNHSYAPYYPPATVVVRPPAPVVYVEQADVAANIAPANPVTLSSPGPVAQAQAQPQQYWHYCVDSKTYYPYVSTCNSPWQKVIPQLTPPSR
jgi:hypothetical protein